MNKVISTSEEEYFHQKELEALHSIKERASSAEEQALRQRHYLRCAKCGTQMEGKELCEVTIEQCPKCRGVYLDSGELEKICESRRPWLLRRIFSSASETPPPHSSAA